MKTFCEGSSIFTYAFVEAMAAGKERLIRRIDNRVIPCQLKSSERQRFEEAKQNGFVSITSRDRYNLSNVWWYWCEVAKIPYVKVVQKRRYAEVSMDLIGLTRHDPDEKDVRRLFLENADKKSRWSIGTFTYCEKVYMDKADFVAAELLKMGCALEKQS